MSDTKELYNEDITRRHFLGGAATTVAGAVASRAGVAAAQDAKALQDPNVASGRVTFKSGNERTVFLSNLEIWVNSITLVIQLFLTGRLLKWFGVGFTLVAMPAISLVGFAAMGIAPSLALLAVFQVGRRAAAYALMRPSREKPTFMRP